MKDDLDLKDFILKSINTFTFENFDFGKKWFQKLQKRDWNNVDWIYNNIKYFREKEFILSDAYPHSHFSNLFRFQYITLFFKRPLHTIKWYLYERMPIYIQHRKILKDTVDYLISEDARDIIEKFPVSNQPGSPFYFTYKNLDVNDRSLMHYHHVNKIRKYLDSKIINNDIKIVLDLGGAYGFFNGLFKTIYPHTTQVLIDFPQQLILAYYFFKTKFPNAKILDFRNFDKCDFSRKELTKYDFILIPPKDFHLLKRNSIDLTCNFISLGEMPRKYFEGYLNSDFYKTSKYYCLCNRYDSSPPCGATYENDITILDYEITKKDIIHFGTFPDLHHYQLLKTFGIFAKKAFLSSDLFFTLLKNPDQDNIN